MGKIRGLVRLKAQLTAKAKRVKAENHVEVTVGYSANYAVHVHENLVIVHANGQAKFLEQPLRELVNNQELVAIINKAVKEGKTLGQALLLAGLRVQRESQKLVPVDTGNLRGSASTTLKAR